jgi:hypothetical protein
MLADTTTLDAVPRPDYWLLNSFAGKWHTTGSMKAGEGHPDLQIVGTDTYEWLPGGFFMVHKVDVRIGDERKQSTEIIGFDAHTNNFRMQSFDDKGESALMYASEHQGVWTFASETLRFTGSFSEDGMIVSGIWEQAEKKGWVFLMDIKLTRDDFQDKINHFNEPNVYFTR